MVAAFSVVDLRGWTRGESEPGGDEEKRWFRAPESSPYSGHWLFKPRQTKALLLSKERQERGDEPDLLIRGENWAEKISYEVAKLIGVPTVETELATVRRLQSDEQLHGSISRDMRPDTWALTSGAALLAERDDEFDAMSCHGHTITAVREALDGISGPVNTDYAQWPAFDVFAGYLVLDAWIANTDRHPRNWAVLQNPVTGDVCLGPSFDHGSALASGNTDDARADRVLRNAVRQWCGHGETKRFDGGAAVSLIDLAGRALSMAGVVARQHWVNQIANVDLVICSDIIEATPDLSDSTRSFLRTVLTTNRKRICDAVH
ncbi:HipA domain-containing protein [[Mycobacterium] zoologicum]|uniref:hypothetical protein n=1 Tax=[Mycobacterium] zoologicum TaxID=2872311 RepID=UPI002CA2CF08|nr:hypothetical protein [Mycolicibacter sp. MYC101]MEB3065671.1 hypothetical protein [Mycolicibacter sp. MYC101]